MPTAPEIAPTATSANACSSRATLRSRLEGESGELEAEGRRLGVDAVRATDAERVRVLARPLAERRDQLAGAGEDDRPGGAELERQRRVEHVGGGEPVMDPAPGLAGRRGEHVDEGGDVVVGDLLALTDRLDREGGGRNRLELRGARALQLLGGCDLDLAPALHPRFVGPEGADLGARVTGDHTDDYPAVADQEFSLVDRTSFAVMERLGITRVASFDNQFSVYRFGPRRSRAFEVIR